MDRDIETACLLVAGLVDPQRRNSVRSALAAIPGVASVDMHSDDAEVTVVFDPSRVVPKQLRVAVGAVGCSVQGIWLPCDAASPLAPETAAFLHRHHLHGEVYAGSPDDAVLGTYLG
jgi:copper chaperone CopZ